MVAAAVGGGVEQDAEADSVLTIARELIALRRSSPLLRAGSFRPLDLPPPLLGFERVGEAGVLRCLFNLTDKTQDCALLASGSLLFASGPVDLDKKSLGGLTACILEMPPAL